MDNTQKWLRQHGRDSELNLSEVLNVAVRNPFWIASSAVATVVQCNSASLHT
jgi:hypothetical protein